MSVIFSSVFPLPEGDCFCGDPFDNGEPVIGHECKKIQRLQHSFSPSSEEDYIDDSAVREISFEREGAPKRIWHCFHRSCLEALVLSETATSRQCPTCREPMDIDSFFPRKARLFRQIKELELPAMGLGLISSTALLSLGNSVILSADMGQYLTRTIAEGIPIIPEIRARITAYATTIRAGLAFTSMRGVVISFLNIIYNLDLDITTSTGMDLFLTNQLSSGLLIATHGSLGSFFGGNFDLSVTYLTSTLSLFSLYLFVEGANVFSMPFAGLEGAAALSEKISRTIFRIQTIGETVFSTASSQLGEGIAIAVKAAAVHLIMNDSTQALGRALNWGQQRIHAIAVGSTAGLHSFCSTQSAKLSTLFGAILAPIYRIFGGQN